MKANLPVWTLLLATSLGYFGAGMAQAEGTIDVGSLSVDNSNREEVRAFFNSLYWESEIAPIAWTGSYSPFPQAGSEEAEVPLLAGDTSEAFKAATLLRINFHRAMAGIPADVVLQDNLNQVAQLTSIIMSGNDEISHFPVPDPPNGIPPFTNYLTATGIQGAAESLLAIGSYGAESIDRLMEDKGAWNFSVGHRRWLLYPPMMEMGTGDTPAAAPPEIPQVALDKIMARRGGTTTFVRRASAVHIFSEANFGPHPVTDFPFVAFPQQGYVPYQLVHPRWSFSIPGANFVNASVSMTRNGEPISVVLEPLDPDPGNPSAAALGDATLVWVYDGQDASQSQTHAKPDSDITYEVTVSGIQNAPQSSYSYSVVVFDPEVPTGGEQTVTTIEGPAEAEIGTPTTFTVNLPDFAIAPGNTNVTGIRYRSFSTTSGDFVEGAENGPGTLITRTSGGYSFIDSSFASSGSNAFHLVTSEIGTSQTLRFPKAYLLGESSSLTFQSMVRSATTTQVAKVNISLDGGVSWINLFSQPGLTPQGEFGGPDENAFTLKSLDLSPYAGRTVHLQFEYEHTGGFAFTQTDSSGGWFFDDITLSGVQRLDSISTSDVLTGAGSFDFVPDDLGDIHLQAQGIFHDQYEMEWGTVFTLTGIEPTGGDTWAGYPIIQGIYVDSFMGFLEISADPQIYSFSLNKYIYMPENFVSQSGAWAYVSLENKPPDAENTWAGYPFLADMVNINTGSFFGFLNVEFAPWAYSYTLNKWLYLPEEFVSESGAWVYILS